VVWVTYQIIVSSSFTLDVTYPPPFSGMLGLMSIFSLDFLAIECVNENENSYFITTYLWCTFPIFLALMIVLIGVMRFVLKAEEQFIVFQQHMWLLLFLSYLVLPSVSSKQLQALDCVPLNDGEMYLRSDTSIDCLSDSYLAFKSSIVLFIISYQMIPIVWMYLLFKNREALNPPGTHLDDRLAVYVRDHNESLKPLRFLFQDYTCSKWWFEIADMYRRITFIGILPLVSTRSTIRASFGCVLGAASVVLFRELNPYRVDFANSVAYVAQYVILITFYFALSISSASLVNFGLEGEKLGAFLICANLLIICSTCWYAWNAHLKYEKQESDKDWMVSVDITHTQTCTYLIPISLFEIFVQNIFSTVWTPVFLSLSHTHMHQLYVKTYNYFFFTLYRPRNTKMLVPSAMANLEPH
jgi:hypothetical protein